MRKVIAFAFIAALVSSDARAQNLPAASPQQQRADSLFAAGAYAAAAPLYQAIIAGNAEQPADVLFSAGAALHEIGQQGAALPLLERAHALRPAHAPTRLRLAKLYTVAGDTARALQHLEALATSGFSNVAAILTSDLLAVQSSERFYAVLDRVIDNQRPCRSDPRYRAFDFWLGAWDVYNNAPAGGFAGNNDITLDVMNCVVMEKWSNAAGLGGTSFNYFLPDTDTWKQVFVFESGGVHEYVGRAEPDGMSFEGAGAVGPGVNALLKMRFTRLPNGDVRQFIEQSTDEGASWQVYFDGIYKKRR